MACSLATPKRSQILVPLKGATIVGAQRHPENERVWNLLSRGLAFVRDETSRQDAWFAPLHPLSAMNRGSASFNGGTLKVYAHAGRDARTQQWQITWKEPTTASSSAPATMAWC